MKSVLGRIAAVTASVMTFTGAGAAGAVVASASTAPVIQCVPDGVILANLGVEQGACAYAAGQSKQIKMLPYPNPEMPKLVMTKWFYPTTTGKFGQISTGVGTSKMCMQLNHAAHNAVVESKCNKTEPSYQMWEPLFIKVPGGATLVEYRSGWHTPLNLCLTFDEQDPQSAHKGLLDATTCTRAAVGITAWYQAFVAG